MTGLQEDERYRRPKYMSFQKGKLRIAIERVGNQVSNYSFYCARED